MKPASGRPTRIKVRVDNVYPDGTRTLEHEAVVPQPGAGEDMGEWADANIRPMTGTGRTEGDAGYFAEIVSTDDPALLGMKFEWGI